MKGFMLTIRNETMAVFSHATIKNFVKLTSAHVRKCFPTEYQSIGDAGLKEIIEYGMARAASHGIQTEREICKYIDLMMVLGRDFDQEPWASAVLNDHGSTPHIKVCRLYERVMDAPKN